VCVRARGPRGRQGGWARAAAGLSRDVWFVASRTPRITAYNAVKTAASANPGPLNGAVARMWSPLSRVTVIGGPWRPSDGGTGKAVPLHVPNPVGFRQTGRDVLRQEIPGPDLARRRQTKRSAGRTPSTASLPSQAGGPASPGATAPGILARQLPGPVWNPTGTGGALGRSARISAAHRFGGDSAGV
jgi:hypothetical protein